MALVACLGCATAAPSDDDDGPSGADAAAGAPDARPGIPDAAPGFPDARPLDTPDATPTGTPDATPTGAPDAMTPPTGVCTAQATLACGDTASDSLLTATNSVSGHACTAIDTTLEDRIYSFVAPTTGSVTLTLDVTIDDAFGDDMDLYVLDGTCNPTACLAHSALTGDDSVTFTATAGRTYFVVVELYAGGVFTFLEYTLTASCP